MPVSDEVDPGEEMRRPFRLSAWSWTFASSSSSVCLVKSGHRASEACCNMHTDQKGPLKIILKIWPKMLTIKSKRQVNYTIHRY